MNAQLMGDNIQPAAYVMQPITLDRVPEAFPPYEQCYEPAKEDPVDRRRGQFSNFAESQMPPDMYLADSPIKSPKERKCRDIVCLAIFFAAWIAAIVLMFQQKMFNSSTEKLTALLMPSDSFRRICGHESQLDKVSTDFGRLIRTASEAKQFCADVKDLAPGIDTAYDCNAIVKDGKIVTAKSREFFSKIRSWNTNLSTFWAVETENSYVCALKQADCSELSGKIYACHRELIEILKKVNPSVSLEQFMDQTEYEEMHAQLIGALPKSEYLLRFCEPMGDAYKHNELLKIIGGDHCEIDYSQKRGQFSKQGMVAYVEYYFDHIVGEFISEIKQQYWYVVAGSASSLVIMIIYTLLLQFIAPVLIWGTLVLLFALLIWGEVEFYLVARSTLQEMNFILEAFGYEDAELERTYDWYLALAVILTVITVVLLILLIIFYKAIRVASGVIGASMSALRSNWYVFLLPLAFLVIAALHAAWSCSAAFLYYTSGEYDARLNQFDFVRYSDENGLLEKATDSGRLCAFIFMVFICIWGFFIVYCCMEYLISAVIVEWYFTYYKKDLKNPLKQAICCLMKSFGTILTTSFITAVICLIRWIFEYVLRRLEQSNRIADNKVVRAAIWFTRCCLKCLQKFVEWINRNVQIVAAISGCGYCKATKDSLKLLFGNFFTSFGVKGLSKFFLFLGEVLVTVLGGVICYFCVIASKAPEMIISPLILTVAISYVVSYYIMHVVEIAIDTVYLCFEYERCFLLKEKEAGSRSFAPRSLAALL